jgi:beta-lactamase regulating signal transducer with metallopeptidase domain
MISILVESVIRSLALGLILWLALTLTRSSNPHLQKMLWSAVLMASLGIPFVMRAHGVPVIQTPDFVLTWQAGVTLQAGGSESAQWRPAWNAVAACYASIALALLLRFAHGLIQMRRIRRDAAVLRASWVGGLDLRVSAEVSSPATFGSTILLPARFSEWSSQKLAAVIAHERAHVLHRDCYVLWLARLYACLFWINPLAWWLRRRLAALAETTSDEAALTAVGDHAGYAGILLEFAGQRAGGGAATAMAQTNIASRIERILSGISPAATPRLSRRVLVLAALLPAVAATAAPLGPTAPIQLTPEAIRTPPGFPGLEKYYPRDAMRRGVAGLVRIHVTLDTRGRATDTLILSEDPLDMGFGAAASELAHVFEYDNPTGRTAQLTFNVKFELPQPPAAPGTTHFENPGGP